MKNFKLLSVLAISLMAFAFTSCNTGSDNNGDLTLEQQKAYQNNMAGTYSDMKLLFDHKNADDVNNQVDSVDTYVNISLRGDSTMTVSNFPIAKMAEHINNAELKEAIANATPQSITIKYMVLSSSTQNIAYFIAGPSPIKLNLTYGSDNKTHEVVLYFGYNTGYCQWSTRQMAFQFYLSYIFVDGKQTDYISNSFRTNYPKYVFFGIQNAWKKGK